MDEPVAFSASHRFTPRGRTVLITGGARGIGHAMTAAFAASGWRVARVDLPGAEPYRGPRPAAVRAIEADLRHDAEITRAVQAAVAAFGGLDAVVNNAAIYPYGAVDQLPAGELAEVLRVNLAAQFALVKAARPELASSGAGRVINISSISARLGFAGGSSYAASKAGVIGFTRAAARELGPLGITVNAICPGSIRTRADRTQELARRDAAAFDQLAIAEQCLPRRGLPADIAAAALFLASDAASFITGQSLVVDGGWIHS